VPKNYKAKSNYRKAAQFALYKKLARKMLMKLTPRVRNQSIQPKSANNFSKHIAK